MKVLKIKKNNSEQRVMKSFGKVLAEDDGCLSPKN